MKKECFPDFLFVYNTDNVAIGLCGGRWNLVITQQFFYCSYLRVRILPDLLQMM